MAVHKAIVRVKTTTDMKGNLRPDIEIRRGFNYSMPELKLGDTEVDVIIFATDDSDLTDIIVSSVDFTQGIADHSGKSYFVKDNTLARADLVIPKAFENSNLKKIGAVI